MTDTADPGLSLERTALAWRRTTLSAAALGLLLVRLGPAHDQPVQILAGAGTLLTAAVLAAAGRTGAVRAAAPRHALIRTVATVLTGLCATALAVVLLQT